ncbi:MAG: hypothetical protein SGJ20_16240 [Planctomycetota bacterium]|nr:hypothetical protein [Planctomycetota bacterium]
MTMLLLAILLLLAMACPVAAQSPAGDIDPGRFDVGNLPSRNIIDPQKLPDHRMSINPIDTPILRVDTLHMMKIDPGPMIEANVAPRWMDSEALVEPTLGISKAFSARASMYKQDPGSLEVGRPSFDGQIFNPIDPGRAVVDPLLQAKIDPGALPERGTQYRSQYGRSTIFLGSPDGRNSEVEANFSNNVSNLPSPRPVPNYLPLGW